MKDYIKCNITIDVDSRLILYSQATKEPKHDVKFSIASIRNLKKFNPQFIIADKTCDTKSIRTCINEEIKASDQIPLKSNFRHCQYRILSIKTFKKYIQEIYSRRNNVESIFDVIKRKYSGTNKNKAHNYKIKKQGSKH